MTAAKRYPAGVPVHEIGTNSGAGVMLAFAPNWTLRVAICRAIGAAAILAASAVWLLPGAELDSEMRLFKLGVSVFFFFCGIALLMGNHRGSQPDAYFDPVGREVRVVQKNARGRPETVLRRGYETLGPAHFTAEGVDLFDGDGTLLMRLAIDSEEVGASLRAQLGGARVR